LIGAALLAVLAWLKPRLPDLFVYPVLLLCFGYAGNGLKNEVKKLSSQQLIWPGNYPVTPATPHKMGHLLVLVPHSGRCWDAPIPCTLALEPGLELRGSKLEEGFRINQQYQRGK
jgi:hypothetical protein